MQEYKHIIMQNRFGQKQLQPRGGATIRTGKIFITQNGGTILWYAIVGVF